MTARFLSSRCLFGRVALAAMLTAITAPTMFAHAWRLIVHRYYA